MSHSATQSTVTPLTTDSITSAPLLTWLASCSPMAVHQIVPSVQRTLGVGRHTANARETRRSEFALGRTCAHAALSELDRLELRPSPSTPYQISVAPDRSPIWPAGFVGSISHSRHWTWAATARILQVRSLGIDTEVCLATEVVNQVRGAVGTESEWAAIDRELSDPCLPSQPPLSPEQATTLVFSAKEAFYKCWFPLLRTYFEFTDVRAELGQTNRLRIHPLPKCPVYALNPQPQEVAFYWLNSQDVFTFTSLPPE